MKFWKIIVYTLVAILVVSLPFISKSTLFRFDQDIDANRFSQYGSYIGGLLGASFAGLSFFILAKTFIQQLATEKSRILNETLSYIDKLYDSTVKEISNLSYKSTRGVEVFYTFNEESLKEPQGLLDQLNSVLSTFENLVDYAKVATYPTDDIKRITLTRIYFLYYSKVLWPVHASIWTTLRDTLEKDHDDSPFYFRKYRELSKETIEYLVRQNQIAGNKDHFRN